MGGLEVGWPIGGIGVPLPNSSAHERHDQLILSIFSINSGYSFRIFSTLHSTCVCMLSHFSHV